MKRVMSLAIAGVAVFALSGCGGDTAGGGDKNYYITYSDGSGVSAIDWSCDGGTNGTTWNDGRFYTEPGNTCDLDLHSGLIIGDIYLENDVGSLDNVRYSCVGNRAHPGIVGDFTGPGGLIDNASHFTGCTLFNLP